MTTTDNRSLKSGSIWLLLVGLLHGIAIWALLQNFGFYGYVKQGDPVLQIVLFGLAVGIPLSIYWIASAPIGAIKRGFSLLIVAAVIAIIAVQQATPWGISDEIKVRPLENFLRSGLIYLSLPLLFVLVHLLVCRTLAYRDYFQITWHNAVASVLALMFTGLVWLLLFSAAWLLETVRIDRLSILLEQEWFAWPVSTLAFSGGFYLSQTRLGMTDALRRYWLILCTALLPVSLVIALIWAAAWPFVEPAKGAQAAIVGFAMICIYCLNAAWQDGDDTAIAGLWSQKILRWLWLTVPILVGAALWRLIVEVGNTGWSTLLIWTAWLLIGLMLHAVGYALPSSKTGWMPWVGRTNVSVAWVMCVSALLLLSPVADANWLSVQHQLSRLESNVVAQDEFDLHALVENKNPYGIQALTELTQSAKKPKSIRKRSQQAIDRPGDRRRFNADNLSDVKRVIDAWPETMELPPSFLEVFLEPKKFARCDGKRLCAAWLQDLDRDGVNEVILAAADGNNANVVLSIYEQIDGKFKAAAHGGTSYQHKITFDALHAAILKRQQVIKTRRWPLLVIDGKVVDFTPSRN